jgi:hypothetical protein
VSNAANEPPLVPLHPDESLSRAKLEQYDRATTRQLIDSLRPGQNGSLNVRPDGTIIDGHHRVKLLRNRGVDVNRLPREIVPKDPAAE